MGSPTRSRSLRRLHNRDRSREANGKTTLVETLAIRTAFSHRGSKTLILSATQDAARRLTESIGATLNGNALTKGAVVDDFATRIRLATGSQIISLASISSATSP